jgi:hypothetical protein
MRWRVRLRIRTDSVSAVVTSGALALLAAASIGWLARGQREVRAAGLAASQAPPVTMRRFYLTADPVLDASQAITACAPGYHMASLWEILDPSELRYNPDLGATAADSGQGPPVWVTTDYHGWVRTGNIASSLDITGLGNCEAWTSNDAAEWGTTATLPLYWGAGVEDVHVWDTGRWPCSASLRVWCVETTVYTTHLPLVWRSA